MDIFVKWKFHDSFSGKTGNVSYIQNQLEILLVNTNIGFWCKFLIGLLIMIVIIKCLLLVSRCHICTVCDDRL